jgi:hypothetical protein
MALPFLVSPFPNMDWCILHNILPRFSALYGSLYHVTVARGKVYPRQAPFEFPEPLAPWVVD